MNIIELATVNRLALAFFTSQCSVDAESGLSDCVRMVFAAQSVVSRARRGAEA